jgi:hypothetical protein
LGRVLLVLVSFLRLHLLARNDRPATIAAGGAAKKVKIEVNRLFQHDGRTIAVQNHIVKV